MAIGLQNVCVREDPLCMEFGVGEGKTSFYSLNSAIICLQKIKWRLKYRQVLDSKNKGLKMERDGQPRSCILCPGNRTALCTALVVLQNSPFQAAVDPLVWQAAEVCGWGRGHI